MGLPLLDPNECAYYTRATKTDVAESLETLVAIESVRQLDNGRDAVVTGETAA